MPLSTDRQTFTCDRCSQTLPVNHTGGSGYATYLPGRTATICYPCCAILDRQTFARGHAPAPLYWTGAWRPYTTRDDRGNITNWAGQLSMPVLSVTRGAHNIAGHQYTLRFRSPDGAMWSGRVYGDQTQLVRNVRQAVRHADR